MTTKATAAGAVDFGSAKGSPLSSAAWADFGGAERNEHRKSERKGEEENVGFVGCVIIG